MRFPACAILLALLSSPLHAASGDILWLDDFEDGALAPQWVLDAHSQHGTAGVNALTAQSGAQSMYLRSGYVVVLSQTIDLEGIASARLAVWIRAGATAFGSNRAEAGENLVLYYRRNDGAWSNLEAFQGGGVAGDVMLREYDLPANAMHANFQLRWIQVDGDHLASDSDWWHIDDVRITDTTGAPPDIGALCDAFGDLTQWTVTGSGAAQVSAATFLSGPSSLSLNGGPVSVTMSSTLGLAGTVASLSLWVRRGANDFSDRPEAGEDLVISYLDNQGNWVTIWQLAGAGTAGQVYNLNYNLPAAALHDGFRLRIRLLNGTSGAMDYWHVDNVCLDIERVIDHFAFQHDGAAVNCQAEPVALLAHDVNHFVIDDYAGTVALATSTMHGDWSLLDGDGVLASNGAGAGSYTFSTADGGAVLLGLRDTFTESVNVNATNGMEAESPLEDAGIAFASAGFNFLVNGSAVPIGTQIAGKPSHAMPGASLIELQAIRSDDETGACEAALTGNVTIDLAFSCENPASCHGANVEINGSAIAANAGGSPAMFTNVALDFGDAADDTAPIAFRYDDAGIIRLHARYALQPSGEMLSGASSGIVVRPFGFHVDAIGNPGAATPDGAAYAAAGADFDVTVRAIAWQAADDTDQDGVADGYADTDATNNADLSDNITLAGFGAESPPDAVSLSAALSLPAGGVHPGLAGNLAVTNFSGGVSQTTVNYSEAGIIELHAQLADSDYLGAGNVASRSGPVGRFIPHHFDVDITSHGCNDTVAFTYSAQPLRALTVTARNGAGQVTQNHDGTAGFARDVQLDAMTAAAGALQNGGISAADFAGGIANIAAEPSGVAFAFTLKESAPAMVRLRATDADGVSSENHAEAQTQVRSARFAMDNANASLLAPAISRLRVDSFDGSEWREEPDDECTLTASDDLALTDHAGGLDAGESVIDLDPLHTFFSAGSGQVTLTAPGVNNEGSMRLRHDAPAWLEFDWNGTGTEDPSALIRFNDFFRTEPGLVDRHEVVD